MGVVLDQTEKLVSKIYSCYDGCPKFGVSLFCFENSEDWVELGSKVETFQPYPCFEKCPMFK